MNSFPEMNLWVVGSAEGSKERDVGGGRGEKPAVGRGVVVVVPGLVRSMEH